MKEREFYALLSSMKSTLERISGELDKLNTGADDWRHEQEKLADEYRQAVAKFDRLNLDQKALIRGQLKFNKPNPSNKII